MAMRIDNPDPKPDVFPSYADKDIGKGPSVCRDGAGQPIQDPTCLPVLARNA